MVVAGTGPAAPPLLSVRRVFVDIAAQSVLRFAPVIDRLEIDAPMLHLRRVGDGRYDVDDVLQRLAANPSDDEPARFAVHNIVVRDGGADFVDEPLQATHQLRAVELGVPFVSSLPSEREVKVEPRLAFTLDGSRFDTRRRGDALRRARQRRGARPRRRLRRRARSSATCRAACRRSCARPRSPPTCASPSSSGRSCR